MISENVKNYLSIHFGIIALEQLNFEDKIIKILEKKSKPLWGKLSSEEREIVWRFNFDGSNERNIGDDLIKYGKLLKGFKSENL